ncbi:conserved phage C-terminal domain-containing protein [Photobacterium damselae subsp. damselae]|uniref:conserved phage C-terminal domain-containing protein n=1 Tax=Photobacterium damselae TaxID=38293 RepID=UPI001F44B4D4|nr:conserved phage C-terminal domain-containing protein [Photobacterium damselae]UKA27168.1 conserved phage C-terminal domain-containing protein [Photobacterium damselae subsp. damselae]
MAIIRTKRKQKFTIINNDVYADNQLSWQAQGLLSYVLSKPDDWNISPAQLSKVTKGTAKPTGRDGVYSILKELINCGYVTRTQKKSQESGLFGSCDYIFHDEPRTTEPCTDEPCTANPILLNTELLLNTDLSPNTVPLNPLEGEKTDPIKLENISVVEYFNDSKIKLNSDLNLTTPRGSRPTTTLLRRLNALRKEKYTTDDFKLVIDYLHQRWGRDNKMHEYFVLGSIFVSSKFDDRLIKAHAWADSGRPTMINGEWYATSKQDDERNKQALAALKNKAGIK